MTSRASPQLRLTTLTMSGAPMRSAHYHHLVRAEVAWGACPVAAAVQRRPRPHCQRPWVQHQLTAMGMMAIRARGVMPTVLVHMVQGWSLITMRLITTPQQQGRVLV